MFWVRILCGYLLACLIGASGITLVLSLLFGGVGGGDGALGDVYLAMLLIALVGCFPTFLLGRWIMMRKQLKAPSHFILLWALAGTMPVLVLGYDAPGELVFLFAMATMAFGALAGLAAHWVEGNLFIQRQTDPSRSGT